MTIKNEKYLTGYNKIDDPRPTFHPKAISITYHEGGEVEVADSGVYSQDTGKANALRLIIDNQERELMAWRSRFPEYAYDAQSGIISYRAFPNKEEDI